MPFERELRRQATAAGLSLTGDDVASMERHYHLLLRWNSSAKLTTITALPEVVSRHFIESILAVPHLGARGGDLLDIGSGGGFPALPILVLRPDYSGTLLEPATRKWAYLKTVVQALDLGSRARVLRRRADSRDEVAAFGPFDCLTMRAVPGHEEIIAGAAAGLRPGGRALLFVGAESAERVRSTLPAGLGLKATVPLPGRRASFLIVLERDA